MTSDEWIDWISATRKSREGVYRSDPDEVTANYNREVGHVRDYHGRELLELLQNADDAGRGFGSNEVKILVCEEGLCVANTGKPFTPAGVKSLVVSDNSPKKEEIAQYIGNRGLGFRAVLNWTECPFVLSGDLRLAFDRERSEEWFRNLADDDDRITELLNTRVEKGEPFPAPVLGVPLALPAEGTEIRTVVRTPPFRSLLRAGEGLVSDGYTTVIGIPFTKPNAYLEVVEKAAELTPELLLFLNHLESVVIATPDESREWRVLERSEHQVVLQVNGDPPLSWSVFRDGGDVPQALLRPDQSNTPDWEVRLAVPEHPITPGRLHNFLPTEVRFPFRLVAHATLELTNNRQNLADTKANAFVAERLAAVLAATAEAIAGPAAPWRGLELTASQGDLDPVLEQFGFEDQLLEELRRRRVIPTRDGDMRTAEDGVRRLSHDPDDWLPVNGFEDLVLWRDDATVRRLLDAMGVRSLTPAEMRERVNRLSDSLGLNERVALIVGLSDRGWLRSPAPALLMGSDGRVIEASKGVFLPPSSSNDFDLPEWLPLRILHSALMAGLMDSFNVGRAEDLRTKLNPYNIKSYSLPALARAVNTRVRQRADAAENEKERDSILLEGIDVLESLFKQIRGHEQLRPLDAPVTIPDRGGEFRPASALYLGDDYGDRGRLCEGLYGFSGDEAFVAPPSCFGWAEDYENGISFLKWLGVASYPRGSTTDVSRRNAPGFFQRLDEQLSYPLRFGNCTAHHPDEFDTWSSVQVKNATTFDRLEEILVHADPHAILGWIATDERLEILRRDGDEAARLHGAPTSRHDLRTLRGQDVPSYALWLIETYEWIPQGNGAEPRSPRECVLESLGAKELRALFPQPSFDDDHPLLEALRVDGRVRRHALERSGIRPTPTEFTWDEFYRLLLQLPEVDPEGYAATKLYGVLLEKSGQPQARMPAHLEFQDRGQLWSVLGEDVRYRDHESVFFLGTRLVPQAVMEALPILPLPATQAGARAENLLGVRVLRSKDIEVTLQHYAAAPQAPRFDTEVEELKYFVAALRFAANPESRGLARLRDLEVVLCDDVFGSATVGSVSIPLVLRQNGEFVIEDRRAYIFYDRPVPDRAFDVPELAASVAELFSSVLEVQEQTTYELLAIHAAERRSTVLQRLVGRDVDPLLREMRERLPELERPIPRQQRAVPVIAQPEESDIDDIEERPDSDIPPNPKSPRPVPVDHRVQPVADTRISPLFPTSPRKISFRVKPTPGATYHPARPGYWTADAKSGEDLAQQFEEGHGRVVLPVGHVQGEETLHCDLLSFESEAERERFEETLDHDLIARLIEVKASTNEKGDIGFSDDLAKTAREYGDRFFLYRVYLGSDNEYRLIELQNPMSYDWPKSYRINPFASAAAKHWDLQPVDSEPESSSSSGAGGTLPSDDH